MQRNQLSNSLREHFRGIISRHPQSILKKLADHDAGHIEQWLNRNPAFKESNVGFQIYPTQNHYRGLLIYNVRRMADFIEKRQLNPNASGEQGLLHKSENLAFHVDPHAKEAWITRLQDAPMP